MKALQPFSWHVAKVAVSLLMIMTSWFMASSTARSRDLVQDLQKQKKPTTHHSRSLSQAHSKVDSETRNATSGVPLTLQQNILLMYSLAVRIHSGLKRGL